MAPSAFEMTDPLANKTKEDNQSVPSREIVEPAISLTMVITDELVPAKLVQQEPTLGEPTCEEDIAEGVMQEGFTHDEQVPLVDLLLEKEILAPKERAPEEQLQSTEPVSSEKMMINPSAEVVIVDAMQFEGRASSDIKDTFRERSYTRVA